MRKILCTLAVLGMTVGAIANDINPAQIGKTTGNKVLDQTDTVPPPTPVNGDEFCNTLFITDSQAYFNGYGNTWGGSAVFGSTQDLQAAQPCDVPGECTLEDCTVDHLTFFGSGGDSLFIATYGDPDGDCVADNTSTGEAVAPVTALTNFTDTAFGLVGARSTAGAGAGVLASTGVNFVNLQLASDPSTGGSSGDWGYTPAGSPVGCDLNLRDGGRGQGGYGTTVWVQSAQLFGQPGALAQQVTGKCGPPIPKCIYQVNSVKIKKDLCGQPICTDCPYPLGTIICTTDCADARECANSLNGTSVCPKGGWCKVKAGLVGCDFCPRGAKRCR